MRCVAWKCLTALLLLSKMWQARKWAKMISKDGHGIGMFYIKHLIEMNGGYFSINAGVNVTNINGIPYANNEFLLSLPLDI